MTPQPTDESPDWYQNAACRGMDISVFYPERRKDNGAARAACVRCDVRDDCLAYALHHNERFGVWGGLDEQERRAMREKRVTTPEERATIRRRLAEGASVNAIAIEMNISWYRVKAVQMESEAAA